MGMYDGIKVVSLRDEPWEQAEKLIRAAYQNNHHTIIIDDAFMMTKEQYEDEDVFTVTVSSEEEAVTCAWDNWWSIE